MHRHSAISAFSLAVALSACASHAPPLAQDQTAVIRGRETAGQSPADATKTVLVDAARLTVDHGFRYFRIVRAGYSAAITPGTDVTIRVVPSEAVRAGAPGIWDADRILTNGVPDSALAAAPTPYPPTATTQRPRCTAYGCVY